MGSYGEGGVRNGAKTNGEGKQEKRRGGGGGGVRKYSGRTDIRVGSKENNDVIYGFYFPLEFIES